MTTHQPATAFGIVVDRPAPSASQTLWHVRRQDGLSVTASLLVGEVIVIEATYGLVGVQHQEFDSVADALAWADRLLARLEAAGLTRHRIDRRSDN